MVCQKSSKLKFLFRTLQSRLTHDRVSQKARIFTERFAQYRRRLKELSPLSATVTGCFRRFFCSPFSVVVYSEPYGSTVRTAERTKTVRTNFRSLVDVERERILNPQTKKRQRRQNSILCHHDICTFPSNCTIAIAIQPPFAYRNQYLILSKAPHRTDRRNLK